MHTLPDASPTDPLEKRVARTCHGMVHFQKWYDDVTAEILAIDADWGNSSALVELSTWQIEERKKPKRI